MISFIISLQIYMLPAKLPKKCLAVHMVFYWTNNKASITFLFSKSGLIEIFRPERLSSHVGVAPVVGQSGEGLAGDWYAQANNICARYSWSAHGYTKGVMLSRLFAAILF